VTTTVGTNNASNGNNEDYKPPVPPHRNTGVGIRLPEPPTPRKHRHRASSGGSSGHHGNNHRHNSKVPQQSNHIVKSHGKTKVDNANKQNGVDEEFVELVNHDDNNRLAKDAGRSREIKRATIVGNPMYSSFSTSAVVSTVVSTINSSTPTGGAASSTTTSPPSSSPSASSSSSSSSSSCASSSCQEQEESVALDDLNLGMDYNQIMQYFDNLKESNA